jgi:hypothetical protein
LKVTIRAKKTETSYSEKGKKHVTEGGLHL